MQCVMQFIQNMLCSSMLSTLLSNVFLKSHHCCARSTTPERVSLMLPSAMYRKFQGAMHIVAVAEIAVILHILLFTLCIKT